MEQIANFDWIEAIGWLASLLTVATYSVSTMLPLRLLAIASALCFAVYAFLLQLWPLLVMDLILLPINLFRFWQVKSLHGKVALASKSHHPDFSVIKTYGNLMRMEAGSVVFEKGDTVDRLYYISEGWVRIEEFGIELAPGDIFGEIAFFTDAAARTATARCSEKSVIYSIDEKQFMRLQFEDPSFGLAIMRTVTRRLTNDVSRIVEHRAL